MKIIKLSKGKEALVCDCHYHLVKNISWHYNARYAMHNVRIGTRRLKKARHIMMHHLIIGIPKKGFQTDHINRDSLDNRCENLRIVTPSENMRNRGKFKCPRPKKVVSNGG